MAERTETASTSHARARPARFRSGGAPTGAWALLATGGLLGGFFAIWQTLDRIAYAGSRDDAALICDVNVVLSCSRVVRPLAVVCSRAAELTGGLACVRRPGLHRRGSHLSTRFLRAALTLTVCVAGFITWYLQQSAFAIGVLVLCLLCVGSALSVGVAGIGLSRAMAHRPASGRGPVSGGRLAMVSSGADVVAWLGLALIIGLMLAVRLF